VGAVLGDLATLKDILQQASTAGIRVRFAVGAASSLAELQLVPAMIREFGDLCNICINIRCDLTSWRGRDWREPVRIGFGTKCSMWRTRSGVNSDHGRKRSFNY